MLKEINKLDGIEELDDIKPAPPGDEEDLRQAEKEETSHGAGGAPDEELAEAIKQNELKKLEHFQDEVLLKLQKEKTP